MSDLRDLLNRAAGEPPANLPLAAIKHRGNALNRRRQAVTGALLAIIIVVVALTATLVGARKPVPPAEPAPRSARTVAPGLLPPGGYVDPVLTPRVSFTIPQGTHWRAVLVTASSLVLAGADSPVTISLQHWSDVYQPVTGTITTPTRLPRPVRLVPWLAAHPSLKPVKAVSKTHLAGQPAERITFTVDRDRRLPQGPALGCSTAADCLVLADTPDNPVVVSTSDVATVIAADRDSSEFVATVMTPLDQATDEATANQVLDSLILQ
jgi:hypothetical protein